MNILVLLPLLSLSLSVDYDYNLQVMELPGSVCLSRSCSPKYLGNLQPNSLNYHGVWPNRLDGNHPFYCTQEKYDPSRLTATTKSGLLSHWNGLYSSSFSFLSHEYEKHGTCFKVPGEPSSSANHQEDFFETALDMMRRTGV